MRDSPLSRVPICFGVFELDPETGELRKQGVKVRLQEQPFQILQILLEHPGKVVTRKELQQRIWPSDTFVDFDQGLYNATKKLREILGDSAESPRFIETIPRRGYRFIAPLDASSDGTVLGVAAQDAYPRHGLRVGVTISVVAAVLGAVLIFAPSARHWIFGKAATPKIRSLAVLPLENLSADPAQEYFSDGMTDALITDLAQIGSVKVISRTSTIQYKRTKKSLPEIARELNVDGVVEGTVQRSGDRVRITVQLLHASSDTHIWASSYERDMRDVFALERNVTEDVARQVQVRLTTENQAVAPRPVKPEALDAYLQGNFYLNRFGRGGGGDEKLRAAEYFQQAIAADPGFAPAYDGMANSHFGVLWPSKQDADLIQREEEKAVELDPNFADAHVTLASIKWSRWDFRGAEVELRRAVALNPNSAKAHEAVGYLAGVLGRKDEGLRECELAQQLDPTGDHIRQALFRLGQYDRAIELAQTMLQSDPDNGYLHDGLYSYYAKKGMYKEASEELEKALLLFGYPDAAAGVRRALVTSGGRNGIKQAALEAEVLMAAKRLYIPGHLAEFYAILGDKDRSFYWLEEIYKHHETSWVTTDHPLEDLKINPMLDSLRSDARYDDLVRRIGLPQ